MGIFVADSTEKVARQDCRDYKCMAACGYHEVQGLCCLGISRQGLSCYHQHLAECAGHGTTFDPYGTKCRLLRGFWLDFKLSDILDPVAVVVTVEDLRGCWKSVSC